MAPGAVSPEVTAMKKRIIMGITGASGAPLAVELLRKIRTIPDAESHVICSRSGALTLRQECGMELEELRRLSHVWYDNGDIGAAVASGSFRTLGMAVVPCSMKTLAGRHRQRLLGLSAPPGCRRYAEGAPASGLDAPGVSAEHPAPAQPDCGQ